MYHNTLDLTTYSLDFQRPINPAAGAELSIVPPSGRLLALANIDFQLACDANAADRIVYLDYRLTLFNYRLGSACFPATANSTWHYIAHPNATLNTVSNLQDLCIAIPDLQLFNDNAELYIRVTNIQAGDQISNVRIIWKTWMLRPA